MVKSRELEMKMKKAEVEKKHVSLFPTNNKKDEFTFSSRYHISQYNSRKQMTW